MIESSSQRQWRIRSWFGDLKEDQLNRLRLFHMELLRFNTKLSLIPGRTEDEADRLHFADALLGSMELLKVVPDRQIHDVGSGNGLPGLILALLAPERQIVLVETDERKCEFLRVCSSRLGLTNVTVEQARFEDLAPDSVSCAVSRGYASLGKAMLVARKPVKLGGEYFHFKTEAWVREAAQIPTQICAFWTPRLVATYELPGDDASQLCLVATKRVA